jgi:regulation of enolase protein 1 (concanavalin A-like superfamily)
MHCGETGGAANSRMVTAGEAVRMDLQQPAIEVATAQRVAFARELPRRELPHPYTMRDHFDVVHNYLTDGTAGTIWSGILNADKASRIDTLPIEIDGVRHGGQLVMAVPENSQTGWSEPARGHTFKNAPYLYVNAPKGDFEARVQFGEITQDLYSNCSLMARLDDDNFLSVGRHEFGPRCFMVRSQQQGVDSDNFGTAEISGRFAMRLVRRGDAFFASYSIDGGETWQAMDWLGTGTAMHRPDLSGPIQVGLWYGTFSDVEGHVAFQDFSLRLSQEQPSEPGKRGANGGIDTEKR